MLRRVVLSALVVAATAGVAVAQAAVESVYTTFNAKTCKHQKGQGIEDYGSGYAPAMRASASC